MITPPFSGSPSVFVFKPADVSGDEITVETKIQFGDEAYDLTNRLLTIKNVQTSKSYSFDGKIDVEQNWTKAVITPKDSSFKGSFPEGEEKTDLSAIKDILKDNITIKDANIYIYLNSKVLKKGDANLRGHISAEYTGGADPKDIIGNGSEAAKFEFTDKLPAEFYAYMKGDKKEPYTGKFPKESAKGDISKLLNDAPKDLQLKYDLKLDELTINNDDSFKNLTPEDKKMNIDLMMELPINLSATKDTEIKKIDSNSLSSTSKAEGDPISEVMDMARHVNMTAYYENNTGLKLKTKIIFKKEAAALVEKELDITDEKGSINFELTPDDINKLKDRKDLLTEFKVILPPGNYKLKEDASLKIKASISSKLKVNKTIKF